MKDDDNRYKYYKFDQKNPEAAPQLVGVLEWARLFENIENRRVAFDAITADVSVSTVFLGVDHGFGRTAAPVLFETMIFGGGHDQRQWRACFYKEAMKQHAEAVALAKSANSTVSRLLNNHLHYGKEEKG